MRKTPFRPDDRRITQSYRDGVVRIYTVTDGAAPGYQPRPVLTLLETLFYQERRVGLQRYYSGKQAQVQDVYPPSIDLTLVRIEQKYEVPHE